MADFGYDKDRFPNLQGEMFDCIICSCVVRTPKQCLGCGNLFCSSCIDSWTKKNAMCPNRCTGSTISPMTSKALIKIYNDLDIRCEKGCLKVVKLFDIIKHQLNCGKPKCWNNEYCDGYANNEFQKLNCSERCFILESLLKTKGDMKEMYEVMKKYKPKEQLVIMPGGPVLPNQNGLAEIKWSQTSCGLGLQFENGGIVVVLKEAAYVFRTVIGTVGFMEGKHYWEIYPDHRTQNELKIGVSTSNSFDFNTAFCDHIFGYAYYGLGQLRHNSNASGPQYGKRLKKDGILGVFLDMDKGQLSFSLSGQNLGVAFEHVSLKKGPIYPAVALLHCAGAVIRGQLPIPRCFK